MQKPQEGIEPCALWGIEKANVVGVREREEEWYEMRSKS